MTQFSFSNATGCLCKPHISVCQRVLQNCPYYTPARLQSMGSDKVPRGELREILYGGLPAFMCPEEGKPKKKNKKTTCHEKLHYIAVIFPFLERIDENSSYAVSNSEACYKHKEVWARWSFITMIILLLINVYKEKYFVFLVIFVFLFLVECKYILQYITQQKQNNTIF